MSKVRKIVTLCKNSKARIFWRPPWESWWISAPDTHFSGRLGCRISRKVLLNSANQSEVGRREVPSSIPASAKPFCLFSNFLVYHGIIISVHISEFLSVLLTFTRVGSFQLFWLTRWFWKVLILHKSVPEWRCSLKRKLRMLDDEHSLSEAS